MIKILNRIPNENESYSLNLQFNISDNENGINFEFKLNNKDYNVFLEYKKYNGKIIEILLTTVDIINELKVNEIFNIVTQNTGTKNTPKSKADRYIARIIFEPNNQNIIIALFDLVKIDTNYEVIKYSNKEYSTTGIMKENSLYFSEILKKRKIKAKLISNTDIYSSISYLESQIDLLTKIILSLEKENNEYKEMLKEADKYSILNIKSKDKIIEEFKNDKAKIRKLQKEYYSEKANS